MRTAILLPMVLVASACGGALAPSLGSPDGGSAQTASTAPSGNTTSTVTEPSMSGNSGPAGTVTGGSSGSCAISASNYDQSCAVDGECTVVATGNFCVGGTFECVGVINVGSLTRYGADVAKTPLGSEGVTSGCNVAAPRPCCRQEQCTTSCQSAADTLPACSSLGGECFYVPPGNSACDASSSVPACAYADETCCLLQPMSQ